MSTEERTVTAAGAGAGDARRWQEAPAKCSPVQRIPAPTSRLQA